MRPFLRRLTTGLLRGVLPLWVLEELEREGPLYGYLLMDRLSARGGDGFRVTPSTLYPALRRLKTGGLVQVFYGTESRGPVRKYYRITAEGRRAVAEARAVAERLTQPTPSPEVGTARGPVAAAVLPTRGGT